MGGSAHRRIIEGLAGSADLCELRGGVACLPTDCRVQQQLLAVEQSQPQQVGDGDVRESRLLIVLTAHERAIFHLPKELIDIIIGHDYERRHSATIGRRGPFRSGV